VHSKFYHNDGDDDDDDDDDDENSSGPFLLEHIVSYTGKRRAP